MSRHPGLISRYGKRRRVATRCACLLVCLALAAGDLWAVPVPEDPQVGTVCGANFKDPSSIPDDFRTGIRKYKLRRWADAVDLMEQALAQSPEDCLFVNTRGTFTEPYLPNLFAGIAMCALQQLDDGRDRAAQTFAAFADLPQKVVRDYEKRCRVGVDEDNDR